DISFLQIEYIRVDKIPESDWIFFYSSNGVKAFAEIVKDLQFDIQSVQIGAYGEATAASIRKQNWPLNFTGTGQAKSTAEKFLPLLNNHKVLFPKAIHSQNALIPYIGNEAKCISLTVYQNHMLPHFLDEVCQYYLFTSGLNVESFFQYN